MTICLSLLSWEWNGGKSLLMAVQCWSQKCRLPLSYSGEYTHSIHFHTFSSDTCSSYLLSQLDCLVSIICYCRISSFGACLFSHFSLELDWSSLVRKVSERKQLCCEWGKKALSFIFPAGCGWREVHLLTFICVMWVGRSKIQKSGVFQWMAAQINTRHKARNFLYFKVQNKQQIEDRFGWVFQSPDTPSRLSFCLTGVKPQHHANPFQPLSGVCFGTRREGCWFFGRCCCCHWENKQYPTVACRCLHLLPPPRNPTLNMWGQTRAFCSPLSEASASSMGTCCWHARWCVINKFAFVPLI